MIEGLFKLIFGLAVAALVVVALAVIVMCITTAAVVVWIGSRIKERLIA